MKKIIADLHVHPGLKGFANQGYPEGEGRTIWDAYPVREKSFKSLNLLIRKSIGELSKESQANLDACSESYLRLPFFALYPVERPLFAPERRKPFRRFLKMAAPERKDVNLGAAVSGFPRERIRSILENNVYNDIDDGVNYYEQYLLEKAHLFEQTTCRSESYPEHCFKLANNYEELRRLLKNEKTIAGVLTVEGAHSFGHYKCHSTFAKIYEELDEAEETLLRQSLLQNVREEKNSRSPAFFIAFSHHFNNLLAGHARSLSDKSSFFSFLPWPNVPGMRHIFNQEPNLNNDFSALGLEVLDLFLDKKQGRRILIDVKHMSVAARRTFYRIIRQRREENGDLIPIISSHTAVSGWPTLEEAAERPETKHIDGDAYFSRWQINLTDEDILAIYDSDGIIGLALNEGRMPGGIFKQETEKYKKLIKKLAKKEDRQSCQKLEEYLWQWRERYLQLLWSNVFHILKVVWDKRGENGWKAIALGSDYGGLVSPFNPYGNAGCFYNLKTEMLAFLLSGKPIYYADQGYSRLLSRSEIQRLMFGRDTEEMVDALFYDNVDLFLSKYFTAEYLGGRKEAQSEKVAEG